MTSLAQLEEQLRASEGTHLNALIPLAQTLRPSPATIDHLILLAEQSDPLVQSRATWLLKNFVSKKAGFTSIQVTKIIELVCSSNSWESRLHLLQMLPELSIPAGSAQQLFESLAEIPTQPNRFVRAWGYTTLHALASQHPSYLSKVAPLLDRALFDEAASVRARFRQLKPLLRS